MRAWVDDKPQTACLFGVADSGVIAQALYDYDAGMVETDLSCQVSFMDPVTERPLFVYMKLQWTKPFPFANSSAEENELSFKEGDYIYSVSVIDDGWWTGVDKVGCNTGRVHWNARCLQS
jgi:hypothetical protein